jgi:O-antigen/teichoic acid export membrane protein
VREPSLRSKQHLPLLISRLGKNGYGVWMLVGQVIAYLAILDLGVGSSVGRFVAKYNAGEDDLRLSRVVNSAIFLFLVSSLFVFFATLILCPNFSKFFTLSDEYYNTGKWLILLTGCGVALSFPLRIGQGVLEGTHNFHLIYLFRASGTFIKLLLIAFFFGLRSFDNLLLLATIAVATTVLPSLFMCGTAFKKLPNASLGFQYVNLLSLREIWSLSLSALLGTFATLLFNQGQIIGVGKMIGPEAAALYAIPVMLLTCSSMVTAYVIAAFKPMASHMQALEKERSLRMLNIKGVKIIFVISLLVAVLVVIFGDSFLQIWLASTELSTQDFKRMSYVLTIMAIGFAIGAPQYVTAKMFSGTDRQWFVTSISLAASSVGLFVGILLMAKTNLGLYGMAIGWTTVFVIRGVFVLPASACRHFKIKSLSYLEQAYLPPSVAAAILTATACTTRAMLNVTSIASLALCIAFCVGVYAVAVYFFCLDEGQRVQARGIVTRLWA